MIKHESYMRQALAAAQEAGTRGDVPVGAVFVLGDEVIAQCGNRRRSSNDPTAHAEVLVLRKAAEVIGNWRTEGTLYVTQEPCPMCAGAIVNARVRAVVFGCENPKAGAAVSLFTILDDARLNHRVEVTGGVLADECAKILTDFFAALRNTKA